MHELSIAQSILSIAQKALPEHHTAVVSGIGIQVGELSAIEVDSLLFAFSVIKADTPFNMAELEIELIRGKATCISCNTVFLLSAYGTPCPNCKGYVINILQGEEMKVLNITIDE
jgi:hydrogenase nickel incorporation protein HypA/HybF